MSVRTLLEIDHDHLPRFDDVDALRRFASQIRAALASGQSEKLPDGVKRVHDPHNPLAVLAEVIASDKFYQHDVPRSVRLRELAGLARAALPQDWRF